MIKTFIPGYIRRSVSFSLILILHLLQAGNPVSVPIDHRIYTFLDRMESLGIVNNLVDGVKPLDRSYIAEILQVIEEKRDRLTHIDRNLLDNFLLDFRYDINRKEPYHLFESNRNWYTPFASINRFKSDVLRLLSRNNPEEENHVVAWEDGTNSFYFDYIMQLEYGSRSDYADRFLQNGTYRFRGSVTPDFGFWLDVQLMSISGNEMYAAAHPQIKTSWYKVQDGKVYFDRSRGELAYHSPFIDFHFAQQPVTWGVGKSGNMIVSDNSEQFPYLELNKRWKWGQFCFMHGKLLAEDTLRSIDSQPIYPDKWIAINRLEMAIFKNFALGLSDIIIYGNRSVEWAYMFPIHFFRPIEHNLKDRDNALLAIDMEYLPISGLKLYGTFLIDELKTSQLGTNWYGNKHGFHGGIHIVDPFSLPNTALRAEYVALMPFVYTHKYTVNRYTNDYRGIGYWSGPNSQVVFAEMEKDWHYRLYSSLTYTNFKHGANFPDKNIGGDIMNGHDVVFPGQSEPVTTRKFLEGIPEQETVWNLTVRYEILNDTFIQAVLIDRNDKIAGKSNHLSEIQAGFYFEY